jgi:hypothetical protein
MGDHIVKATIEVADTKVTFEGPPEFVDAQVAKYAAQRVSNTQEKLGTGTQDAPVSEQQLVDRKQPSGHIETVAVLAFALTQAGTDEFTEDDIRRAYIRAGVRPPKVVAQALRDAKNRADFIELGSTKGTYRLSPHGDRTVRFDLPRKS